MIIPTKDRPELLKRAIDSVLMQSWPSLEVVVVDDGSGSETAQVLEKIREKGVPLRFVRNRVSKGAAASRNIALEMAKGEYVSGLDDDDVWYPNRLERLFEALAEGYSAAAAWDLFMRNGRMQVWKKPPEIGYEDLLWYNRIGNQVLVRRSRLQELGGYDEDLPSAQDYDLWLRLTRRFGPIRIVQEALQTVFEERNRRRITTGAKQAEGYYRCYLKHKTEMSASQRRYQLYRIRLAAGKRVGCGELFRASPRSLITKEILRWIQS